MNWTSDCKKMICEIKGDQNLLHEKVFWKTVKLKV